MSSSTQFGVLTTLDGVTPVAGNIGLTSSDSSITITPGVGTIDLMAVGGGGGGITTIDGDVSSVTGSTITLTGGSSGGLFTGDGSATMTMSFTELNLPDTTSSSMGVININSTPVFHCYPGISSNNLFVGNGAGNFSTGSADNISIGHGTGASLTSGSVNVFVGNTAGTALRDGAENVAVGHVALVKATSANQIVAIGCNAADNLLTGIYNTAIGFDSGGNWAGSESYNICIHSTGVIGDMNTLRIGLGGDIGGGDITTSYIGGIFGNTPSGTAQVCYVDTNGLMSSSATVAASVTIDGDVSSVTGSTITLTGGTSGAVFTGNGSTTMTESFNFLDVPDTALTGSTITSGYISFDGTVTIHNFASTDNENIFCGGFAGSPHATSGVALYNSGFGSTTLTSLTTGTNNSCGGYSSGLDIDSGNFNTSWGSGSLGTLNSTNDNCAFGYNSLANLVNGHACIAIGSGAGSGYTSNESANICIGAVGVAGDGATLRLGTSLSSSYISGIFGNTPSGTAQVVYVDTNGLMTSSAASPGGIKTWTDVTGTSQAIAANGGYAADHASTPVSFSLPSTAAIGSLITITGKATGGWTITQASGQKINFGSSSTTLGATGTLSSTLQFDSVQLVCITANTIWNVISSVGNLTVV